MDSPRIVSVEIHGQRYPIRSSLDAGYVAALASYVDEKMQAASDEVATADTVKVAVLAAINIADEYFRCRDGDDSEQARLARRTAEIERLLDEALASFP